MNKHKILYQKMAKVKIKIVVFAFAMFVCCLFNDENPEKHQASKDKQVKKEQSAKI